ncbi:MAG: NAD kinase [Bacteroidia bacterium]|nr:MAG: NAD kinase [Bacteroidia bacterium]
MNIALYARNTIANKPELVLEIYQKLKEQNNQLFICESYYNFLKNNFNFNLDVPIICNTEDFLNYKIDLLISLGGDGTLLETLSLIKKLPIPVFGINTGKLGFLTYDFNQNISDAIDLILQKKYSIEKRNLIELILPQHDIGEINYALNEIVIHKKDTGSMLYIEIFIDDQYLTTFFADGVIVSTATGSTAYSLSCGGPILEPGLNAMIITPIASHSLNARPIVISNQHILSFKLYGRNPQYTLSLDSRVYQPNMDFSKESIKVSKLAHQFQLVIPHPFHFFHSLKTKLYWGTDKRF